MSYHLQGDCFTIGRYDLQKSFASFLPGLCGENGIPLWCFYVNRGQAIAGFGAGDRDGAIMEFSPFPIAMEDVGRKGFRTFLRWQNGDVYEPFATGNPAKRRMDVRPNSLMIEENNKTLGLTVTVSYFLLPHMPIGALVRRLTITNTGSTSKQIELLDGLARVLPYGIPNSQFKEMANLMKSYTEVEGLYNKVPLYRSRSSVADSAEVSAYTGGHFALAFLQGKKLPFLADTQLAFGADTALGVPLGLAAQGVAGLLAQPQYTGNQIPCALAAVQLDLAAGESATLLETYGYCANAADLEGVEQKLGNPIFIEQKLGEANALVQGLTGSFAVKTGQPVLDEYLQQSQLDNLLRGGKPVKLGGHTLYLFGRKHGDLERDYNFFSTQAGYYSQGNGNFRDVCQNRRNSVTLQPETGAYDIEAFAELIQLDGYNPLELLPPVFTLADESSATQSLRGLGLNPLQLEAVLAACKGDFAPGQVAYAAAQCGADMNTVMDTVLAHSEEKRQANHKEGFWCDHWTYLPHLLESYAHIWPDKLANLLFGAGSLRYWNSEAYVLPRAKRVVLAQNGPRQYHATGRRDITSRWATLQNAETLRVNLFAKLYLLAFVKLACFDAAQLGIEMEGGKPGWNDALNGLPGLFGSSTSEVFDLLILCETLQSYTALAGKTVLMPTPFAVFTGKVGALLAKAPQKGDKRFSFWQAMAALREEWYETALKPLPPGVEEVPAENICCALETAIAFLRDVHTRLQAYRPDGLAPTYFTYDATSWLPTGETDGQGRPYVTVLALTGHPMELFLETPAKQLAVLPKQQAAYQHKSIRKTALYDAKLKMYKTSGPLANASLEIGRIRTFEPGWFERESIFMHMQYKYLLALLQKGLYEEFYTDARHCLAPYFAPAVYGRNVLENSSFLVSSAGANPALHGQGFVARLSGSTAEVVSMWLHMFLGAKLFTLQAGAVTFTFAPVLPGWMFDETGTVRVIYLGCEIFYHNPAKADTWQASITHIVAEGKSIAGNSLPPELAQAFRSKSIDEMHVYLE